MVPVIKTSDPRGQAVRALPVPVPVSVMPQAAPVDEITPLRATVARLEAALDAERARQQQVVAAARASGHVEGKREGLAEAASREAERVEVVQGGVRDLRLAVDRRLCELEGLAVALARAGLGQLFDRTEEMASMVAATLSRHIGRLRDEVVVSVRVSGEDFADAGALRAKIAGLGQAVEVTVDPGLPSGACRASYAMGRIDLDFQGQWAALAALLGEDAA